MITEHKETGMAAKPSTFGREAELPGELTTQSLADLLGADDQAVTERIREQFDRIREAERHWRPSDR